MIVTLTPNPALDIKMVVRRPRLGTLNRAQRMFLEPSGKGINVSRALAALGLPSTAVAPLGGPIGASLQGALEGAAFELASVPIAGHTRANSKILDADDGALTEFNSPGPSLSAAEWQTLEDAVAGRAGRGDVAVLSGSLPPSTPASAYAALVTRLRPAGAFTVVDADGPALREALAARPNVIKPNRREAEELLGRPLRTAADAADAADELRALGAERVLLTLDRAGAVLAAADVTVLAVPPRTEVRNPTGAGDAALAGLLLGRYEKLRDETLAQLSVAAGSVRAGAAAPRFGDAAAVRALAAEVVTLTLRPAALEAWRRLELDTLSVHAVRRAAAAGTDTTRRPT